MNEKPIMTMKNATKITSGYMQSKGTQSLLYTMPKSARALDQHEGLTSNQAKDHKAIKQPKYFKFNFQSDLINQNEPYNSTDSKDARAAPQKDEMAPSPTQNNANVSIFNQQKQHNRISFMEKISEQLEETPDIKMS